MKESAREQRTLISPENGYYGGKIISGPITQFNWFANFSFFGLIYVNLRVLNRLQHSRDRKGKRKRGGLV